MKTLYLIGILSLSLQAEATSVWTRCFGGSTTTPFSRRTSELGMETWNQLVLAHPDRNIAFSPVALVNSLAGLASAADGTLHSAIVDGLCVKHIRDLTKPLNQCRAQWAQTVPRIRWDTEILWRVGKTQVFYPERLRELGIRVYSQKPAEDQPKTVVLNRFELLSQRPQKFDESSQEFFSRTKPAVKARFHTFRNLLGYYRRYDGDQVDFYSVPYGPDLSLDILVSRIPDRVPKLSDFSSYEFLLSHLQTVRIDLSYPEIDLRTTVDLTGILKRRWSDVFERDSYHPNILASGSLETRFRPDALHQDINFHLGVPIRRRDYLRLLRDRALPSHTVTLNKPFVFALRRPSDNLIVLMGAVTEIPQ